MFQLRNINLKDCCYMIAQAWDSTSGCTRNEILGYNEECAIQLRSCDDNCTAIIEIFKNSKLSWDRVDQLLAVDNNSLFGTLTDDEILEAVEEDENEDADVSDMFDKPNEGLSHSEAYSCRFEVDGSAGKIQRYPADATETYL
ncbi:hypothetical protein T01_3559 [Trichinella spiralis]|uniref:DDE-1 domain-containing protein n=2 Tax=Trichinella spiralis TaxID=6334 RepID=A0A0V1BYQ3_TRISP|nr:hypothetical protein T01_3559 [Trichinella spiralis]